MAIAIPKPAPSMTLDEFLKLDFINESPAWQYINGEAIQKPMGGLQHSTLQKRLVAIIDSVALQQGGEFEAFPELRCTPNGRSVVPDVSVMRVVDLPVEETKDQLSQKGIEFAPAWMIEVLSPDQSQTKVTDNILYCLQHGSRLGWLIDASAAAVIVFRPGQLPEVLTGDSVLPVLDELSLELSPEQIFAWLRRR